MLDSSCNSSDNNTNTDNNGYPDHFYLQYIHINFPILIITSKIHQPTSCKNGLNTTLPPPCSSQLHHIHFLAWPAMCGTFQNSLSHVSIPIKYLLDKYDTDYAGNLLHVFSMFTTMANIHYYDKKISH